MNSFLSGLLGREVCQTTFDAVIFWCITTVTNSIITCLASLPLWTAGVLCGFTLRAKPCGLLPVAGRFFLICFLRISHRSAWRNSISVVFLCAALRAFRYVDCRPRQMSVKICHSTLSDTEKIHHSFGNIALRTVPPLFINQCKQQSNMALYLTTSRIEYVLITIGDIVESRTSVPANFPGHSHCALFIEPDWFDRNVPFDNTTLIYLINLPLKLGLWLALDLKLQYFSIFTENKEKEHLFFGEFHRR